jgi:hypothetical protein
VNELDRIVTLPNQPAMTQQPRVAVQSPGDPVARQIPFWRAVEDVIRSTPLIADPQSYGMHVHELDNAGFDGSATTFVGLLPSEPDLSGGKTVSIYVRGTGLFTYTAGTPGAFEFTLGGDTNQDVTFGQVLETGDVAVAVYAGRTDAPPRYLYLAGSVMIPSAGTTPWVWTFAGTSAGTIEAGASGSVATCETAATSDVVAVLCHNGTSIGTLTYAAGSATGGFTVASPVSLAVGDRVYLTFPSPADATLAGVSVTMRVKYDG